MFEKICFGHGWEASRIFKNAKDLVDQAYNERRSLSPAERDSVETALTALLYAITKYVPEPSIFEFVEMVRRKVIEGASPDEISALLQRLEDIIRIETIKQS
jgi:hypothetical protein